VLCLSAKYFSLQTSRDFARAVAEDGYLPRSFHQPGAALVYSEGIWLLASLSGVLLLAFDGVTDRLIPLFAVGAFLAFTLSQGGMVAHWWKKQERGRACQHGGQRAGGNCYRRHGSGHGCRQVRGRRLGGGSVSAFARRTDAPRSAAIIEESNEKPRRPAI